MKVMLRYALVLLVIVGATGLNGQFFRETYIDYYHDDAFLDFIGWDYRYCDGWTDTGGSVGSWRVFDQYSCRTGARVVHKCQQTDGMGGWIDMSCPAHLP